MEAAPHLHLIDTSTGEVEKVCPDCLNLERQNRSLLRQRTMLEHELARVQGSEPEAEHVRDVLDYWARRVVDEGWWSRRPLFRPGDQRWSAVRGRLKDGRTVADCEAVVDGALLQGKGEGRFQIKRAWVDATSIFRNNENFERHLEHALDPARQWVRAIQEVPPQLRDRWQDVLDAADQCDCGHLRFDHAKWDDLRDGRQECLVHGCHCTDFEDELDRKITGWMRDQEATDG